MTKIERFLKEQPVRARAFADGQPISDSDVAVHSEEDLNRLARTPLGEKPQCRDSYENILSKR